MPSPAPSLARTPPHRQPNGVAQLREEAKAKIRSIIARIAPARPRVTPHRPDHFCFVKLVYGFESARSNIGRWQKRCRTCPFAAWATGEIPTEQLEHEGVYAQLDILNSLKPIPRSPRTPAHGSPRTPAHGSPRTPAHGSPPKSGTGSLQSTPDAPPPYPADGNPRSAATPPPPSNSPSSKPAKGRDHIQITVLIWLSENESPLKFQCTARPEGHFALTDYKNVRLCFADVDPIQLETYEAATQCWEDGHTLDTVRPTAHGDILLYRTEGLDMTTCAGLTAQLKVVQRMHAEATTTNLHGIHMNNKARAVPRLGAQVSGLARKTFKRRLQVLDSEDEGAVLPCPSQKRRKSNFVVTNDDNEVIIVSD